ncbi:MAG: Rossman fold protein, TIGR00730 family [Candidatus Dactylopiibacterium carminicum]|uniref:Cytokinin riboside 5'-monophosphate phosphoribohydrolase n=1 Tax=Candidatus Dactylopiibacterium carminicum TaxID=857335 RepID=A0A272EPL8_9RHOO|nr:TIGR00730 family Rossman fold protein [Candidatus Dactylopiibacterium carminicum]KAF7598071.1 TIGR00730 family Rossman fold protein [Candidatus Dactylopiibacterium carminicum]PAS91630.1 MAG: Rossman fold protein, TIGR00730 family [Candidatus Dactylopiibacterium carminicum]PAS93610.1 MAG: Rossman fold protein, TIGR00730 family [Candidatus Dactylopiibacterium carminicum]PAS96513.1 MAG: Rossman fold protein, TIGR00730 family [Candidatus Dactylopiibacterium carminicum]
MKSICVFCGATAGTDPAYREAARAFGETLAREDLGLVWGGGHVGLMGVVADAVHAGHGRSFGVIPGFMVERELAHPFATELLVVESMHARKAAMAERAGGFVALPGGIGTLDELFEIMTWAQLHIHAKPIGLLNVKGFFDPLLAFLRHLVAQGFVKQAHLDLLKIADDPATLLAQMRQHRPLEGDWIGKLKPEQA